MGKLQIRQAVKREAKAHVAFIGISGSGKSYTSLLLARRLAGPTGKILAVDSEGGSLSKYADVFRFDVIEPDSFSLDVFQEAIDLAEQHNYDVFLVDSLSHFWMGKDGALEFVEERKLKARQKGGDQMDGWRDFKPHERAMVDRILRSKCHVIVTMRTKNEYAVTEYVDSNGKTKTKRTKIGLAPVQREGLEYEMDLVATFDEDNNMLVEKSRVLLPDASNPYQGKAFAKPNVGTFEKFCEWLKGAPAERPSDRPQQPPQPKSAQPAAKPESQPKGESTQSRRGDEGAADPRKDTAPLTEEDQLLAEFTAADKFGRLRILGDLKKDLREVTGDDAEYYRVLLAVGGVQHANEFKSLAVAKRTLSALYRTMEAHTAAVTVEPQDSMSADQFVEGLEPEGVTA